MTPPPAPSAARPVCYGRFPDNPQHQAESGCESCEHGSRCQATALAREAAEFEPNGLTLEAAERWFADTLAALSNPQDWERRWLARAPWGYTEFAPPTPFEDGTDAYMPALKFGLIALAPEPRATGEYMVLLVEGGSYQSEVDNLSEEVSDEERKDLYKIMRFVRREHVQNIIRSQNIIARVDQAIGNEIEEDKQ